MSRLQQLEEFIKESPNDVFLHYALTMEYVKLEEIDKAREGFNYLVNNYPDYIGTYYHFGKFCEKTGDKIIAEDIYNRGILIAKNQRKTHALNELQGALNLLKGIDEDDY